MTNHISACEPISVAEHLRGKLPKMKKLTNIYALQGPRNKNTDVFFIRGTNIINHATV